MSSSPSTLIDNLTTADGYLDEAFGFEDDLDEDERYNLTIARDYLQKVINSVGIRLQAAEDGTSGQDRESYSDTQDRDEYTVNDA